MGREGGEWQRMSVVMNVREVRSVDRGGREGERLAMCSVKLWETGVWCCFCVKEITLLNTCICT